MNKQFSLIAILCLSITFTILLSCSPSNISGSEVTNERFISLTGHVLSKNGAGVPGIEASLSGLGFSDTTDQNGFYTISISEDSLISLNISLEALTDTLFVKQNNSIVNSFEITRFIDTLPDTYLIQRNVYGKLLPSSTQIDSIEAVITLKGSATDTVTIALWLNKATQDFSVFVYMLPADQSTIFSVYVNTYDIQGRFTGRSTTIDFPGNAGDIKIPDFVPTNALPYFSDLSEPIATINDTVTVSASVHDNFEGKIVEMAWSFDSAKTFIQADSSNSAHTFYTKLGTYLAIARAIDNDSNVIFDTATISIISAPPTISAGNDTSATILDSIVLTATASDLFNGTITDIAWSFDSAKTFITAIEAKGIFYSGIAGEHWAIARATDDDMNQVFDTVTISLLQAPPTVSAGNDTSATILDSIVLTATASDLFNGTITDIAWSFDSAKTFITAIEAKGIFYSGIAGEHWAIARATDDDNNRVYDTVTVLLTNKTPTIVINADSITYAPNSPVFVSLTVEDDGDSYSVELKHGNSAFQTVPADNISFTAPDTVAAQYPVIVRVTDEDSNSVEDTVNVGIGVFAINLKNNTRGEEVLATADGGFLITGFTTSDGIRGDDIVIIKTDNRGHIEWEKIIGDNNLRDAGLSCIETEEQDFIISGFIQTDSQMKSDVFFTKIGKDGTTIWQNNILASNSEELSIITQTPEGDFLLSGRKGYDVYLINITTHGDTNWSRIVPLDTLEGHSYYSKRITSVLPALDNGFILTGFMMGLYGRDDSFSYVAKIDKLGKLLWAKRLPSVDIHTRARDMIQTENNDFLIIGDYRDGWGTPAGHFVKKIDEFGNEIWSINRYSWPGWGTNKIIKLDPSKYLITGGIGYGIINENGQELINKKLPVTNYDEYPHSVRSVNHTSDNGFVFTGIHDDDNKTLFLIKTDADGNTTEFVRKK